MAVGEGDEGDRFEFGAAVGHHVVGELDGLFVGSEEKGSAFFRYVVALFDFFVDAADGEAEYELAAHYHEAVDEREPEVEADVCVDGGHLVGHKADGGVEDRGDKCALHNRVDVVGRGEAYYAAVGFEGYRGDGVDEEGQANFDGEVVDGVGCEGIPYEPERNECTRHNHKIDCEDDPAGHIIIEKNL